METKKYDDGSAYTGELDGEQPHGHGIFIWSDGAAYSGEWRKGKRNGQGVLTYSDGASYTGGWKNDKAHGQGTAIYADGSNYSGEWRHDKRHGLGTFVDAAGTSWEGQWQNDEFIEQPASDSSTEGGLLRNVWAYVFAAILGAVIVNWYSGQESNETRVSAKSNPASFDVPVVPHGTETGRNVDRSESRNVDRSETSAAGSTDADGLACINALHAEDDDTVVGGRPRWNTYGMHPDLPPPPTCPRTWKGYTVNNVGDVAALPESFFTGSLDDQMRNYAAINIDALEQPIRSKVYRALIERQREANLRAAAQGRKKFLEGN